jgi:hypothetical protein
VVATDPAVAGMALHPLNLADYLLAASMSASSATIAEDEMQGTNPHLRWVCLASRKLTNAAKLTPEWARHGTEKQGAVTHRELRSFLFSSLQRLKFQPGKFQPVCQTGPWANRTPAPTPLSSTPPGPRPLRAAYLIVRISVGAG